jgi:hypothetical protein
MSVLRYEVPVELTRRQLFALRFSQSAFRKNAAVKLIHNIGLYLAHLLTALIGTALLSTGCGFLFHPDHLLESFRKKW